MKFLSPHPPCTHPLSPAAPLLFPSFSLLIHFRFPLHFRMLSSLGLPNLPFFFNLSFCLPSFIVFLLKLASPFLPRVSLSLSLYPSFFSSHLVLLLFLTFPDHALLFFPVCLSFLSFLINPSPQFHYLSFHDLSFLFTISIIISFVPCSLLPVIPYFSSHHQQLLTLSRSCFPTTLFFFPVLTFLSLLSLVSNPQNLPSFLFLYFSPSLSPPSLFSSSLLKPNS